MPQVKSAFSVLPLVIACAIAIALTAPAAIVSAATVELTVPIKSAFDATAATADSQTAAKLNSHYRDLGALLAQDKESVVRI
jgi:hypothetical protein